MIWINYAIKRLRIASATERFLEINKKRMLKGVVRVSAHIIPREDRTFWLIQRQVLPANLADAINSEFHRNEYL